MVDTYDTLDNNTTIENWEVMWVLRWLKRNYDIEYRGLNYRFREYATRPGWDGWADWNNRTIKISFSCGYEPSAYTKQTIQGPKIINPSGKWEYLVVSLIHELRHIEREDVQHDIIWFDEWDALQRWRKRNSPGLRWFGIWAATVAEKWRASR